MSSDMIIALMSLAGIIIGVIPTYLFMRQKGVAEVEKLKAETDKFKAEAENIRAGRPANEISKAPKSGQNGYEARISNVERSQLTDYYIEQANASNSIDIITLTMQVILANYGEDRLINWIVGGKNIRVLVLSPCSMAARLRSRDENAGESYLTDKIIRQIERLQQGVYDKAKRQIAKSKECLGSLEVRFYDGIPYFAYFRTEKSMAIGLYYSHQKGLQSEAIFVDDPKSIVYKKMGGHFDVLWDRDVAGLTKKSRTVCLISHSDTHFINMQALKKLAIQSDGVQNGKMG